MSSLTALIAPALLLATPWTHGSVVLADDHSEANQAAQPALPLTSGGRAAGPTLEDLLQQGAANQVRVQQRIIIRIAPRRRTTKTDLLANLPQGERSTQVVERKVGKCLPLKGIAGVQATRDNRLLLFMRDNRIIRANLEKACRARDFYSGFYVERNRDGNVCINRDMLQARSGAKCEMTRIRQLVTIDA